MPIAFGSSKGFFIENSTMIKDLFFDFPLAAFLIPGVFLFVLAGMFLHRHRLSVMQQYSKIVQMVMLPRDPVSTWVKGTLLCLTWLAAVLALMQPKGNSHYAPNRVLSTGQEEGIPTHQMQFILDTSASMQVKDIRNQTRSEYGKEIVDELARQLDGKSASLWGFAGQATRLSPATMDALFLRLMIRDLQINEGNVTGTSLINAVKAIQKEISELPQDRKLVAVLLSDGEDTENISAEEKAKNLRVLLDDLKTKFKDRLTIYTIGIGSREGGEIPDVLEQGQRIHSKRDDTWLKQIGESSGEYIIADQESSIEIAQDILSKMKKKNLEEWISKPNETSSVKEDMVQSLIYTLYFQYPLAFALLFLTIEILFPIVRHQTRSPK
ncbi:MULTISPECIES: VWA domain-containing protein [Parachlamydia]|jgi:Ca-activated chloride channel family protein|uniref:VWA domain-containing protein n=1 Tax=Parachlamydia TaxID=83551 RepID=UPI001D03C695|nr:VWA domain-containing protein [Parachlamydia acanthamoebae]